MGDKCIPVQYPSLLTSCNFTVMKFVVFNSKTDLLDLSVSESEDDQDWWIKGVPDRHSTPVLRPEPATFGNQHTVDELISLGDDLTQNETDNASMGY